MTYYLYHIPGKKIGVTRDLEERVHKQQGYYPGEYEIIEQSDEVPYNKLKFNNMRINVTEQTTTFPCPINKLKGQLMDNMGMKWETDHGELSITPSTIDWIMRNVKESMYNDKRSYVYNKAFARFYDNHDIHNTRTGGLFPTGVRQEKAKAVTHFDLIREWASERGLYDNGDPKTQALKLVEEVGETCRAILKQDHKEAVDGIGDCVVVLTNLAELMNTNIETCIDIAYNEIKDRKGKMDNGTFKKD